MPAVARAGSNDLLMLDTPPQERSVQSTASGRSRDFFHSSPTPSNIMPSSLASQVMMYVACCVLSDSKHSLILRFHSRNKGSSGHVSFFGRACWSRLSLGMC